MKSFARFAPAFAALLVFVVWGCSAPPAEDMESGGTAATSEADQGPTLYEQLLEVAVVEEMVMMPMRDGVRLATHIYRPKDSGSNPVPTIFVKTPYNMNLWGDGEMNDGRFRGPLDAVRHGYAYVNQNERGKFYSEG